VPGIGGLTLPAVIFGPVKLLIADDNAEMRTLLRRLCWTIATATRECGDGREAVDAFEEFAPDWTIMDLSMPVMDGLAATRQILAAHPGAQIVVVTQHRGCEYEQAARAAGACALVLKDDLQPLLSLLASAAKSNSTRAATQS